MKNKKSCKSKSLIKSSYSISKNEIENNGNKLIEPKSIPKKKKLILKKGN